MAGLQAHSRGRGGEGAGAESVQMGLISLIIAAGSATLQHLCAGIHRLALGFDPESCGQVPALGIMT